MLEFKLALTDVVVAALKPIYDSLQKYDGDRGYVEKVLDDGAKRANAIAQENLRCINEILSAL
jgi:tryptophanyl-tRNA synthetase